MHLGEKLKRTYSTLLFFKKKFKSSPLMNKPSEDGIWTIGTVQSN